MPHSRPPHAFTSFQLSSSSEQRTGQHAFIIAAPALSATQLMLALRRHASEARLRARGERRDAAKRHMLPARYAKAMLFRCLLTPLFADDFLLLSAAAITFADDVCHSHLRDFSPSRCLLIDDFLSRFAIYAAAAYLPSCCCFRLAATLRCRCRRFIMMMFTLRR